MDELCRWNQEKWEKHETSFTDLEPLSESNAKTIDIVILLSEIPQYQCPQTRNLIKTSVNLFQRPG